MKLYILNILKYHEDIHEKEIINNNKLICYYNDNNTLKNKDEKKMNINIIKKENIKLDMEINKVDFGEIFDKVKKVRNDIIIKKDLHIIILKDKDFQQQIFKICIGIFNEFSENNKELDKMLDIAIKYNITPCNEAEKTNYSYIEYIDHLLNDSLDVELEVSKKDFVYVEKYMEFVFKSYNLSKYNKIGVSKKDIDVKNTYFKKNEFQII